MKEGRILSLKVLFNC